MQQRIANVSRLPAPRPARPWAGVLCACLSLLPWGAAGAQGRTAAPPRLEVETLPAAWQDSQAPALQRDALAQAALGSSEARLRARWWWRRGALELGAGADYWKAGNAGAALALKANPVLGLRAELSQRTHLVYELSVAPEASPFSGAAAQQSRWALEFKGKSQDRALPAGFLRVQLAGGSTLQLRPRGGGLSVAYRSRF